MRIDEILARAQEPVFSFEFFPPKTDDGERVLGLALESLRQLEPDFVSVTYGSGGSTRDRTVKLTKWIKQELGIETMAHLTCVGASRDELHAMLRETGAAGIDNVLALRGDPPRGETTWTPHPEGLTHAAELVELIADDYEFCVGAACFPEVHVDAPDLARDLEHLKRKVDGGVSFLITNLFFDNELYFRFVEEARAVGIEVPILPGIMPITSTRSDQDDHRPVRRDDPGGADVSSSSCGPATATRCSSSASPTRPCSAPNCWPAAPRACTSTRSTAHRRRARSCPRSSCCGRGSGARSSTWRSDLERVGEHRLPVELVAHVDLVVALVGADPPEPQ